MPIRINTHFHVWPRNPRNPEKNAERLTQQFDSFPQASDWVREEGYDRNEQASIHVCAGDHPDPTTGKRTTPTKSQVLQAMKRAVRELERKYAETRIVLENINVRFEPRTGKQRPR